MPLPSMFPGGLSPVGQALGLGRTPGLGDALAGQTGESVDELRRRRMQEEQQRALLGTTGSAAGTALGLGGSPFGGIGGRNGTGLL